MAQSAYRKARRHVDVSVGESVRIMRELQELSQTELAERTGIPQSTLSAIENDRLNLGVERAKVLARALKCHPAVLVFPGWTVGDESAACIRMRTDLPCLGRPRTGAVAGPSPADAIMEGASAR
jgi:transcriptional regulator with XRE-family HTH domain